MALERERKFLVKRLPDLSGVKKEEIIQKYLSSDPELRVRKIGERYILTKKGPGTHTRREEEMEISSTLFLFLEGDRPPMRIRKTRYYLPLSRELVAELDVYKEEFQGFYSVEVEFDGKEEMEAFIPPEWFGLEVTERRDMTNYQMVKNGIPGDIQRSLQEYHLSGTD